MWKQKNVQMNYWGYKYRVMFKIKMIHVSSYPMLQNGGGVNITRIPTCTLFHLINSTINVLKQFWHFNALMVSQYVNIWKSASHVEYCAVKSLSGTLILIHPSPWQPCFSFNMTNINYKRYVADQRLSAIYNICIFTRYILLHIKQNILQLLTL